MISVRWTKFGSKINCFKYIYLKIYKFHVLVRLLIAIHFQIHNIKLKKIFIRIRIKSINYTRVKKQYIH